MILKYFELEKKISEKNKFFLFYGSNKGLIQDTIKNTIQHISKEKIHRYEENEVIKNTEIFLEDISNMSFFENEKFIIINRATDKLFKIVENIIEKNINGISILLISDVLEKKSKLRNFFEKEKTTICVPFYEDNLKTLNLLATNFFKEKKISLSQQNINLLIDRSRGDRMNLYNELTKIECYLENKKNIKIEEIIKLTNLSDNYDLTELVDYSLAKNQRRTINILNENNFSTEDSIIILRIFVRKLKRLFKIHLKNIEEQNVEKTISNFKPPIFWKEKDVLKEQLKIWNLDKVKELLVKTNEMELLVKKHQQNSINLVTDFILEQANKANN
tara:strand:+ start:2334 stop:3329 length:996 start_codon:yes stop_codon:yes gene_type:complete